jgi:enoyl-CoA hydratase|tara:strand:- start:4521 stop:5414 length:894 start_codon:yes stop_codon:yes gene_type:complete
MELETLIYKKEGRIATLTLNRAHKGNAISVQLRDELDLVMDDLDQDDETRVLIIDAAGAHFSTGYDLNEFSYLWDADSAINEVQRRPHRQAPVWSRREFHLSRERWMRLFRLRQATIGVVHGHCVAGGLDLVGVMDIVFCADDALLGQPESRAMGEIHTFGLWPIHMGMRKTKEWLFTGDNMTGTEAAEIGLVNRAVPRDEVAAVARAYAERVSNVTLDAIYSHKEVTNRWFETMGMNAAMAAANDLDAMGIAGPGMDRFNEVWKEGGVRPAVRDRDAPFKPHRSYWQAYEASKEDK